MEQQKHQRAVLLLSFQPEALQADQQIMLAWLQQQPSDAQSQVRYQPLKASLSAHKLC